jgi:hypothetical protein
VKIFKERLDDDDDASLKGDSRFTMLKQRALTNYAKKHSFAARKMSLIGSFLSEPGAPRRTFISSFMG